MRKFIAICVLSLLFHLSLAWASPSLVLPSYHNGFAQHAGESAFPHMWRGLVGVWAPFLGQTGMTLRDWSGYENHGAFTNMVVGDWIIGADSRRPGYALDLAESSTNYIAPADILAARAMTSISVVARVYHTSNGGFDEMASEWGGTTRNFRLDTGGDGNYDFGITAGGMNTTADGSTSSVTLGEWVHVAGTYNEVDITIWKNAQLAERKVHDAGGPIQTTASDDGLRLGQRITGRLSYVFIYNRALTAAEIALDSQYPGAALWLRDAAVGFVAAAPPAGRRIIIIGQAPEVKPFSLVHVLRDPLGEDLMQWSRNRKVNNVSTQGQP